MKELVLPTCVPPSFSSHDTSDQTEQILPQRASKDIKATYLQISNKANAHQLANI